MHLGITMQEEAIVDENSLYVDKKDFDEIGFYDWNSIHQPVLKT